MPILSKQIVDKILGREWSFGYNCYEVGHTWTPSCTDAALEVSTAAGLKVLPLYALLYGFSQVALQRRYDLAATWDTTKSVARSSFFIFFHAYNGAIMGCGLRNSFGRFYYRILVCVPALISSYLSLLIEKPARRQALAFYLLNLASEILFRMAVTKGLFKPPKNGETLLFALSLAAWYHLIKAHGFGHDPVSAIAKALVGRNEAKRRPPRGDQHAALEGPKHSQRQQRQEEQQGQRQSFADRLMVRASESAPAWLVGKHCSCPHGQASCLRYILSPVPSRLAVGWAIQSLLNLTRKPQNLLAAPLDTAREAASAPNSIPFGVFLASLVTGGRLTSCLLRHIYDCERPWHPAAAGFVAGLSMLWAPRSSISMYVMWKAVEQYYLLAVRQGKVRYFDLTISTIYSVSAATILYTFALEPRFVRPSYMKFLDNLSDHRLHQLNRMVLDVFGTGSSIGYEDYFPNLDPKFMSNQFKELIFNWMIQPYE